MSQNENKEENKDSSKDSKTEFKTPSKVEDGNGGGGGGGGNPWRFTCEPLSDTQFNVKRSHEEFCIDIRHWTIRASYDSSSRVHAILAKYDKQADYRSPKMCAATGKTLCLSAWRDLLELDCVETVPKAYSVFVSNSFFVMIDFLLSQTDSSDNKKYPTGILPFGTFVVHSHVGSSYSGYRWRLDTRLTNPKSYYPFDFIEITLPASVTQELKGRDSDGHYLMTDTPTLLTLDKLAPPRISFEPRSYDERAFTYPLLHWIAVQSSSSSSFDCDSLFFDSEFSTLMSKSVQGANVCLNVWKAICKTGTFVDKESNATATYIRSMLESRIST